MAEVSFTLPNGKLLIVTSVKISDGGTLASIRDCYYAEPHTADEVTYDDIEYVEGKYYSSLHQFASDNY